MRCPQLKEIYLMDCGSDSDTLGKVVNGMLEAAGRAGKVNVIYKDEDDVLI